MNKDDLKGIRLLMHLAYIVYQESSVACEKKKKTDRLTQYAHFTRLEVEHRILYIQVIILSSLNSILQIYTRVK